MNNLLLINFMCIILTACGAAPTETATAPLSTPEAVSATPTVSIPDAPVETSAPATDDFFTKTK